MAERRLPLHLAAFLGCSTGAYALSLTGITALQSAADAALIRERGPMAAALDTVAADHADLERSMRELADQYDRLAATYADLGNGFEQYEAGLDSIARLAASISKSASSLPTRLALPAVGSAARRAAPPQTHATTGASGGG